jgi:hypothetical protein
MQRKPEKVVLPVATIRGCSPVEKVEAQIADAEAKAF